jgi:hypothetical protein
MSSFAFFTGLALVTAAKLLSRLGRSTTQRRVFAGVLIAGALVALWRPWVLLTTARASCHVSASDFAFSFSEMH